MYVDVWYVIQNNVGAIINYNILKKYNLYVIHEILYISCDGVQNLSKISHSNVQEKEKS